MHTYTGIYNIHMTIQPPRYTYINIETYTYTHIYTTVLNLLVWD